MPSAQSPPCLQAILQRLKLGAAPPVPSALPQDLLLLNSLSLSPGRSASFFPRGILLPVATCLGLCSWTSLEPTLMQLAPRQVKFQKARLQ